MKQIRLSTLGLVLSMLTSPTAYGWVKTTIYEGDVSYNTSIAVDSSANVHISYFDPTTEELEYATNTSGSWVITTLDSGIGHWGFNSIAVDSSDKVHVSYFDLANNDLKHATNTSGSWVITTVDSDPGGWASNAIAVDSSNHAHVCYFNRESWALTYATNLSGDWVTVPLANMIEAQPSIAVDSSDKVHISYYSGDLRYATNLSGNWVFTSVDQAQPFVYRGNNSIVTDSSNKAHVSYFDYDSRTLKYATNSSGDWVVNSIHSSTDLTGFNSIALDSSGYVHVSYTYQYWCEDSSPDCHGLRYANNASGDWVTYAIDTGGGTDNSIVTDSLDRVHISYGDSFNQGGLYYMINECVSESCKNQVDDDCDGLIDSADGDCPCSDSDSDGYGDPTNPSCSQPELDCNDSNPNVYPTSPNSYCNCEEPYPQGIAEICDDGIDNNCDGLVDNCGGSCVGAVQASTLDTSPVIASSDLAKRLAWFLLPVGAVIGLRIWRRRR
jgi:hypothetical protein